MSLENLEKKLKEKRKKRITSTSKKGSSTLPKKKAVRVKFSGKSKKSKKSSKRNILFLFLGSFIFLVLVGAGAVYAVYSVLVKGDDSQQVQLEVGVPNEVRKGIPFDVEVTVFNNGSNQLRDSEILLRLPPELINLRGIEGGEAVVRDTVGDIGGNSLLRRTFKLLPVGPEEVQFPGDSLEQTEIIISLSYGTGGRTRFESDKSISIDIMPAPIQVSVKMPESPIAGSFFDVEIEYKNDSEFDFSGIGLGVDYPSSFRYVSASMSPSFLNNFWRVGELRVNSTGDLSIRGFLSGDQVQGQSLVVTVYTTYMDRDYPLVKREVTFSPAPSPVKLEIFANGRSSYNASLGETITYDLHFENQSGVALSSVEIRASLVGEMFDLDSVRLESGEIDRMTGEIAWKPSTMGNLSILEPGAKRTASFKVNIKDSFPIRRFGDKNYIVRVDAVLSSPTVPNYIESNELTSRSSLSTKIKGMVSVTGRAFFRDASSEILNQGSLPPKVGQSTEFTIHWIIRNYATDIKGAEVRATLKPGVEWTGIIKSNIDSVPVFEEGSREVVWDIGEIYAGRGMIDGPIQAVFQVKATPSQSNVGFFMPLLDRAIIVADDTFTGSVLRSSSSALDTFLPHDPTVMVGQGLVFP